MPDENYLWHKKGCRSTRKLDFNLFYLTLESTESELP